MRATHIGLVQDMVMGLLKGSSSMMPLFLKSRGVGFAANKVKQSFIFYMKHISVFHQSLLKLQKTNTSNFASAHLSWVSGCGWLVVVWRHWVAQVGDTMMLYCPSWLATLLRILGNQNGEDLGSWEYSYFWDCQPGQHWEGRMTSRDSWVHSYHQSRHYQSVSMGL